MEKSQDATPFNFAMLYYIGLNELLGHKEKAAVEGNLIGYYTGLKQIGLRISFKLNKTEKKDSKDMLNKAKALVYAPSPRSQNAAMQMATLINEELRDVLEEIDERIWFLMDKYKMIFPSITLASGGLDGIRKRLNLPGAKK